MRVENSRKLIAIAVTYCVLETALLLSIAARTAQEVTTWYGLAIIFLQLLTIPFIAALIFRLNYGRSRIALRSLAVIATGAIGAPITATAALLFVVGLGTVIFYPENRATASVFLVGSIATLVGIGLLLTKAHAWAQKREIALYLEEKRLGVHLENQAARRRALRVATILPVTLVGTIYIFFLPVWGLVSHARDIVPPGYAIKIPSTWIVADRWNSGNGGFYMSGVTPCNMLPHVSPRRCLGVWDLHTAEFGQTSGPYWWPRWVVMKADRSYSLGDETVTCLVVDDRSNGWPYYECSGRSRLRTSYAGPASGIDDFHAMMEGAIHMP
jgi:hypothetical protein